MSSNVTAAAARRITAAAKAAAPGVRFETSSEGSYSFRVVLHDTLLSGLDDITAGRAASDAIRALDGMTTTWGRARTGKIVINVTDETVRETLITEQEAKRAAALEAARAEVAAAPTYRVVEVAHALSGGGQLAGAFAAEHEAARVHLTPAVVTLTNPELWA